MKNSLAPLLFAACAALGSGLALAEKADRGKPMNIEADALRHDEQKQLSTFTGKVVVTKGTIVMRGARLEVRQDAQGNQFGTLTAAPGQRAFYRQKREGLDEFTEGEAELLEYDGRSDRIKLSQRAELRRYRGSAQSDQIEGTVIVFDNTTEVFTVDGKANEGSGGGRVRAMLSPRPATNTANPASPGAAPSPGLPPLRPSKSLGGDGK